MVNRLTHGYTPCHKARLRGWRRAWRYTAARQVAYLTVIADPGCEIDGLIAPVPEDGWRVLDHRERAYDRLPASHAVSHAAGGDPEIAVYAIAPNRLHLPDADHPVLLSYIDVVIQGYLAEYGREGAERFVATTTGWDAPVFDDRAAPVYARAQRLTGPERNFVDAVLRETGCKPFAAPLDRAPTGDA
nr:gamma-glutamylcyclotransferase family protein [Thalassococcus arenae]